VLLAISGEWLTFLEALSQNPPGQPFCFYQADIDFLYVIMGEGDCSDWNRLSTGQMIFQGADVIDKMWPEDHQNGDSFAGLELWGGVQNFLSYNYKDALGHRYERYRVNHNSLRYVTAVAEIIEFLERDSRGLATSRWQHWRPRVMKALADKNPMVHIPLLELP
jgi:hypothetical protein